MFSLGKQAQPPKRKGGKKPAKGARSSPSTQSTSSTASGGSVTSMITAEPFQRKQAGKVDWIKELLPGERVPLIDGMKSMGNDDPVLFCRWNNANFTYKRNAAANNGGITTLNHLANLIEANGGNRIDGSNCAFAFTNMGVLLRCKQQMLATAPWVRHVDAGGLRAAAVAALGAHGRSICDEVILVSQAPAPGAVVAARFPEFFF